MVACFNSGVAVAGLRCALTEAKLAELERKVDVIMKGLNLLLFGEGEVISEAELRDLKGRLEDYLASRSYEFVKLDELQ
jgi:hypothetical protein